MGTVMFTFAWPWMAVLLLLPPLIWALMPPRKVKEIEQMPEVSFPYIQRLQASFQPATRIDMSRPFYLAGLALTWFGLTLALMQPQLVDRYTQVQNKGHDLMLAVDLSGSMQALDFTDSDGHRVSRHQVIEQVVSDFVTHRSGDRVGLVLFGSNAYLQIPLTYDIASVRKFVNNTRVGEAGDATAIGDAIGLAVKNLRDRPANSRAIILLTDGGDNASTVPPLEAAKLAAQYGIKIFTIGVGSNGPVPIPDQNGNIVMAQMDLDEGLLKKIADMTGGAYFRAADTEALQNSYREIDRLEKTTSEAQSYAIRTPLYRYPLGAALILLLALSAAPVYRRARHGF
jgi:Ca-activated chloride channel family protein